MTEILREPVTGPSAWRAADAPHLKTLYRMTPENLADLDAAFRACRSRPWHEITRETFPLGSLEKPVAHLFDEMKTGVGFGTLSGLPVYDYSPEDLSTIFWGLSTHIGTAVTQNSHEEFVVHVYDKRSGLGLLNKRGNYSNVKGYFHVDLTDIVALLCYRQAKSGGESRLVSTMSIYNEILKERPEVLDILYKGFAWDRRNQQYPGETPTSESPIPIFSYGHGDLSCKYHRGNIKFASDRSGVPLTEEETEAMAYLESVAERPDLHIEFPLQPGDLLFCNNYTVFHDRNAFEDYDEDDRRRHMMRLWLFADDFRKFADEKAMRYGVIRYANLGLSAEELWRSKQTKQRVSV